MARSTATVALVAPFLAATVFGQDTTPCETYDINSGTATCGGKSVAIGSVICASGFDPSKCKASMPDGRGGTETYYFKGTPTGLPAGSSIQSDCGSGDFPSGGGVAMAQTYQDASGSPAGCYPAADVQGTTMTFTANADSSLASVTINFNVHTDAGGTQRDGFVKIQCQPGGPTSDFRYSTVGDQGHPSQYEVDTTADCANSGGGPPGPPGPPSPPAGPTGYWCVANTTCLYGPQPNPTYKGGTEDECKAICHPPAYQCVSDQCVPAASGGTLEECKSLCGIAAEQ